MQIINSAVSVVWMNINNGLHKDMNTIQLALETFKVHDWAKDMLKSPRFVLAKSVEHIELCRATTLELTGFKRALWSEVYKVIQVVGEPCEPEDAVSLRLVYLSQPNGEWLRVAINPINSEGVPSIFTLTSGFGARCLRARVARPDSVFEGNDSFVFRKRKVYKEEEGDQRPN